MARAKKHRRFTRNSLSVSAKIGELGADIATNVAELKATSEMLQNVLSTVIDMLRPPPPPEADMAYETKDEESSGVTVMFDTLVNDVEAETQEAKLEGKDAQGEY